jgi:hypothetical protein
MVRQAHHEWLSRMFYTAVGYQIIQPDIAIKQWDFGVTGGKAGLFEFGED